MRGLMLLETMVVVAIIAVLAAFVAPPLSGWIIRDRVDARLRTWLATLAEARSEAIRTGARIIVCRLDGAQHCILSSRAGQGTGAGGMVDWKSGYAIAFDRGSQSSAAPILRLVKAMPGVTMRGAARPIIFMPPIGQQIGGFRSFEIGPADDKTIDQANRHWYRCVRIAAGGRARVEIGPC